MIISASRRTDIPAFYSPWFMNRIREGFLLTRNPFNAHQIKRVSLLAKDIDVIVFWTRNPRKLLAHLDELDSMGFNYYFQYTITGYSREIESSVPNLHQAIQTFITLSDRIGADKIIWRYDPILVSNIVNISQHKQLFERIAAQLYGKTKKVVISFSDFYKKTEKNLALVNGLKYVDIISKPDSLNSLVCYMADIAMRYNMIIETCAEEIDTSISGISHGKCIDDVLIKNLFGISVSSEKDKGQRKPCGCIKSIDIGSYNTCLHGCSYCYATYDKESVLKNKEKHDPNSPFLVGGIEDISTDLLAPPIVQDLLF